MQVILKKDLTIFNNIAIQTRAEMTDRTDRQTEHLLRSISHLQLQCHSIAIQGDLC